MIQPILHRMEKITWYLLVISLPFTSMPAVKKILGADSVASPAILFLVILFLLFLFRLIHERRLLISKKSMPLLLFSCAAILAVLFSFFLNPPAFKDFGYFHPGLSALATLGLGVMFFVGASSFPVETDVKRKTLNLINWSGLIILIWCLIQGISWYGTYHYPQWMFNFQGVFSARVLFRQRVTGFALEPSWLAHQLNMLYLPLWLSSTITGYSSHSFKIKKISFENLLLMGGIIVLGLTLSRVGFAAFIMMVLIVVYMLHNRFVAAVYSWLQKKKANKIHLNIKQISFGMMFVYLFVGVLFLIIYSRFDPRMAGLFKINFGQDNALLRYFNQMKFGDRVIYWLTGWNIFNQYPVLGVGLGNAGFYFPDNIPSYGWSLLEVRKLLYRSHLLLNVKSLWFRLLAETGIIGFSIFIGWLISLYSALTEKLRSTRLIEKTLGFTGVFVLFGLVFEGLSIDSFAMPYWWVSLGLAVTSIDDGSPYEKLKTEKHDAAAA